MQEQFRVKLEAIGIEQIEIVAWWCWFDRVTAHQPR